METEQAQATAEVETFVLAMFNYVFPRRFDDEWIPRRFDGTDKLQETEIHFKSDIGEAVLLVCYVHGNSFLRRFVLEHPDYVADIHTLYRYCRRYALELYDEENIFNSLLIFSAMFVELVSYCLMQAVESGTRFVNYADEYWSLIFESQFERSFFASGGWKTLQEISQVKAQIYEEIKRVYPSYSNEDVPFHYWIGDVDPETVETSVFEAGYCRIISRIQQIIHSDQLFKPLFQKIVDSNAKSDLEANTMQQQVYVPWSDDTLTSQASDYFRGLSLQRNEDLKSEVSMIPGSVSATVPTSMDRVDSYMERVDTPETESTELDAIPKAIPRSGEVWRTVGNIFDMEIPLDKKDLIETFKDRTFYTNILDGLYIEKLFDDKEKTRILINSYFLRNMKDTVNSPKKPDTKKLVEEARNIIIVATSAAALNNPSLQNPAPDIYILSSDDSEQNFDEQNLQKPEIENLPLAGKVKFSAEVKSQQEEHLDRSYRPKIGKKISPGKVNKLKFEVRSNTTSINFLKAYIATALLTLKNKCLTQWETSERRKHLLSGIESRYIRQVFQHLSSELGVTFPDTYTSCLDSLNTPYMRQGICIMMELMNVSHTLTDRILELLNALPVCSPRMQMDNNLKELISERTSIRIAMTTLGHSCSNSYRIHNRKQYFAELIRVLICECGYFLQLKWNLKVVKGHLREGKGITELANSPVREDVKQSVSQSTADVKSGKRKRGTQLDVSPSKYKVLDTPCSSGLAAVDNSSNSSVSSTKHLRLPSGVAVAPVQMSESRSLEENVKDSSDSEENKY